MVIERERYLDDGSDWLISIGLRSKSGPTHSLLTALSSDERAAVADALTGALDVIAPLLRAKLRESAQ